MFALLSYKDLEIGGLWRIDGGAHLFLSAKQSCEVLLHLGQAGDKLCTDIFKSIQILEKGAVIEASCDFHRLIQMCVLVVLEVLIKKLWKPSDDFAVRCDELVDLESIKGKLLLLGFTRKGIHD